MFEHWVFLSQELVHFNLHLVVFAVLDDELGHFHQLLVRTGPRSNRLFGGRLGLGLLEAFLGLVGLNDELCDLQELWMDVCRFFFDLDQRSEVFPQQLVDLT